MDYLVADYVFSIAAISCIYWVLLLMSSSALEWVISKCSGEPYVSNPISKAMYLYYLKWTPVSTSYFKYIDGRGTYHTGWGLWFYPVLVAMSASLSVVILCIYWEVLLVTVDITVVLCTLIYWFSTWKDEQ